MSAPQEEGGSVTLEALARQYLPEAVFNNLPGSGAQAQIDEVEISLKRKNEDEGGYDDESKRQKVELDPSLLLEEDPTQVSAESAATLASLLLHNLPDGEADLMPQDYAPPPPPELDAEGNPVPVKRGRGRPKKNPSDPPKARGPRGRPPKARPLDADGNPLPPPPKNPRGRPRKDPNAPYDPVKEEARRLKKEKREKRLAEERALRELEERTEMEFDNALEQGGPLPPRVLAEMGGTPLKRSSRRLTKTSRKSMAENVNSDGEEIDEDGNVIKEDDEYDPSDEDYEEGDDEEPKKKAKPAAVAPPFPPSQEYVDNVLAGPSGSNGGDQANALLAAAELASFANMSGMGGAGSTSSTGLEDINLGGAFEGIAGLAPGTFVQADGIENPLADSDAILAAIASLSNGPNGINVMPTQE